MKMCVQLNNQTDFNFTKIFFERILEETIALSGFACLKQKNVELSVALVSGERITELNKRYRTKNKVTDVLSFAEYDSRENLCASAGREVFLGELIICPVYVAQSAREQDFSLENEMVYIVSHGILHLMGLDHGDEMFSIQQEVVNKIIEKK